MAGSQLKRLKASLHKEGLIGPQKSKKDKKRDSKSGVKRMDKRAALEGIREQFNPFDLKHNVRGPKFDVTSNRPTNKAIHGRPLEAKTASEERRRETLMVDEQRKNKVGGIVDRRFGENDPTLAPEERMLERFARETQSRHKKSSMFDLEDDEPGFDLTHGGKALSLDGPALVDDFQEDMGGLSDEDEDSEGRRAYLKRKALTEGEDMEVDDAQPERKKTKQEIYSEIMAKSKAHKAARQEAKEEDEDIREELNKELNSIRDLLFRTKDPRNNEPLDKAAEDAERVKMEKEYDLRVRQMLQDRRAAPTERTKTDEEQAAEASARLQKLEDKRQKRMRGEQDSESESEGEKEEKVPAADFMEEDEEDEFGLGSGIAKKSKLLPTATELGFDDEDDFEIEDDLVASGSELSFDEQDEDDEDGSDEDGEDDDEFTKGLLSENEMKDPAFSKGSNTSSKADPDGVPYSFASCPETHQELLDATKDVPVGKLPVVVVRIRTLFHAQLDSQNKAKLGNFTLALIHHLPYLASQRKLAPFSVFEQLIRHIHSLAKTYPIEVAVGFRSHLEDLAKTRPLDPNLGDLIMYTAIGTIFPPSDHFHQVVTPAQLEIARFLGQKMPKQLSDLAKGVYLSILILQYQQISKRYMPELINFNLNTLLALAPQPRKNVPFPMHELPAGYRVNNAQAAEIRKLNCYDCVESERSAKEQNVFKIAIIDSTIKVLEAAATLWVDKSSFIETFEPFKQLLGHLSSKPCRSHFPDSLKDRLRKTQTRVEQMLKLAQIQRKPLELHHHRPLAIKSNMPKFEDTFDPNKHYDPDRERAEAAKLRAEFKNERKGAMRELRKDANFMAREKLRIKKAKDEAYEKKYKRLVAEIQGEEGRESNAYAREKEARKKAAKRNK
ncbi:nucleosome assembly protein [Apiospora arundinis]|uniref:Nucleolar protein 14 n=1 Tax=Apiospora arundinis TaxID=335852 RepID=A0ABR2J7B4_9PEZI